MVFAFRVAPTGIPSAGPRTSLSGRLPLFGIVQFAATLIVLALVAAGVSMNQPSIMMSTCAAILLFGLPHGTFDLALVEQAHADRRIGAVAALYLGCAAAMYALWQLVPALALASFFAISIIHFAEDWDGALPPFFAHGTAGALLTAPALLHHGELIVLFALFGGPVASSALADAALLVAPVALLVATAGVIVMWLDDRRYLALSTTAALAAMLFVSPVVGFALYFCLMHSPAQFDASRRTLDGNPLMHWTRIVLPVMAAALGIAMLVLANLESATLSDAMITTVFVTLSVLTLPHMVVPLLLAKLRSAEDQTSYGKSVTSD